MPIPNADKAYVPAEKLSDYLLDEQHPVGGSKAKFFRGVGYDAADPSVLERDLLKIVQHADAVSEKDSPFGTKYVVAGKMTAPNGTEVNVTTVWIVETPEDRPRLVTAYPGDKL
jgi:hypothetical protein